MGKFYFCEVCDLRQPNSASLVKHMREDHQCEEEFVARNPDLVQYFSEVCPSCSIRVLNLSELLAHATLVHGFNGTARQEVFQSFLEFEEWKERMEEENISTWVARKHKTTGNVLTINMKCHRALKSIAHYREESNLLGNTKLARRSCTSYMNVERNLRTDVTAVEYCLEHFGHEKDLLKQSLPWSVKMEIADMLKQNLTASQIVKYLKEKSMADNKDGSCVLKRQYWITNKDVRSVAAHFKIYPHKYERMEGIRPEVLAKTEPDSSEASPELFAKMEPDSSEASPELFAKTEPDSTEASPELFAKTEPDSTEASPEVLAKAEPDSSEAHPEVLAKTEPDSSEAPAAPEDPKEPSPEELKALIDEALLRVFSKSKAAKTPPSTEVKPKRPVFWFCELCDMRQPNAASLIKHMRDEHQCGEEFVARNPDLVENAPELCPSCGICVLDVTELLAHATLVHEFDGVVRREVFQNFAEFEQWKERMENESISTWVRRKRPTKKTATNVITISLRCHRTQSTMPMGRKLLHDNPKLRKRKLAKVVQRSCTSFMDVERNLETDATSVVYCLEHFGHRQDPKKQYLPWSVKLEIAEMLKQNMFARDIVRTLRKKSIMESEDGARRLKRQFWVNRNDVYRVGKDLRARPHKYGITEGVGPELPVKTEPDSSEASTARSSEASTAPEFFKEEPCASSSSILESFIERELSHVKNACPEEAVFKANPDPAESSDERPKKEEPCSAFSIAEVIPGGEVGPTGSASPKVPVKRESGPDSAESSAVPKKRLKKEEPRSAFSIAEVIPGGEVGPTASAGPKVVVKTESGPDSSESPSVAEKLFIKEEPISVTTLLPESSSTSMELSSDEAKPPSDEGVRVFSLALAPDGKGFALVDQSGSPQDIL